MMRAERGVEPELVAFLEHHRIVAEVPPEVRVRALAAARSIVASGGVVPGRALVTRPSRPTVVAMPVSRGRAARRVALAASMAIAAAAVGAAAAFQARRDQATPPVAGPSESRVTTPSAPAARVGRPWPEAPAAPAPRATPVTPSRSRRLAAAAKVEKLDASAAELELLQRAHATYTRHDFSAALVLLSEHARRFPKGQLAEQREALRVRSLAGAGRRDEAHRAAAGFAVRFPRSVLLPRLEGGSESPVP